MRKLIITISIIFFVVNSVNACPIPERDKDDMLSELCSFGEKKDGGQWRNSGLNNMIILINYGKLPPDYSPKGIQMLAGLTCSFRDYTN